MGQTRKQVAFLALLMALSVLAACGSPKPPDFNKLLLTPADFPGQVVETEGPEISAAATGQSSAQVTLRGPDYIVQHSVIWFDSPQEALATLEVIKSDHAQQGYLAPAESGQFDGLSDTIAEGGGTGERVSLAFVEGPALERLSVSGPRRQEMLPQLAEMARRKLNP